MRVLTTSVVALSLIALGLLWPGAAAAQVEDEVGVVTIYQQTTILELPAGTVEGKMPTPSAAYGVVKREARFDLTIRVRTSFLPEVMNTASNL